MSLFSIRADLVDEHDPEIFPLPSRQPDLTFPTPPFQRALEVLT